MHIIIYSIDLLMRSQKKTYAIQSVYFYDNKVICFLISAIALPGFKFLGHALVQFNIVWHR